MITVGPSGILNMQELEKNTVLIENNLKLLNETHDVLNQKLDKITNSPESIILEARNLGYIQENEKLVVLQKSDKRSEYLSLGSFVPLAIMQTSTMLPILLASICVFCISFILLNTAKQGASNGRVYSRARI